MTRRLNYIDIAKGLGMLAIIWGHICCKGWSNCLVYSFHIPLFFFISGMMFNREKYPTFIGFLKKRAKRLLIPYAIYSVVTWMIWVAFNMVFKRPVESIWQPLLQTLIAKGSGGFLVYNVALWFVPCLLAVELMYYLLSKFKLGGVIFSFVIAALSMYFASIYGEKYNHFWPWNLDSAFVALPFYALGHQLTLGIGHKKLIEVSNNNRFSVFSISIVLTIILYFLGRKYGPISMGHSQFGNEYIFHIRALIGCASTILFSLWFSSIKWKPIDPITKYLSWFGENSFDVMATNNPIKGIFCTIIAILFNIHVNDASFTDIPHSLMAFIPTMIVDTIVVYFILRFKTFWNNKISKTIA